MTTTGISGLPATNLDAVKEVLQLLMHGRRSGGMTEAHADRGMDGVRSVLDHVAVMDGGSIRGVDRGGSTEVAAIHVLDSGIVDHPIGGHTFGGAKAASEVSAGAVAAELGKHWMRDWSPYEGHR